MFINSFWKWVGEVWNTDELLGLVISLLIIGLSFGLVFWSDLPTLALIAAVAVLLGEWAFIDLIRNNEVESVGDVLLSKILCILGSVPFAIILTYAAFNYKKVFQITFSILNILKIHWLNMLTTTMVIAGVVAVISVWVWFNWKMAQKRTLQKRQQEELRNEVVEHLNRRKKVAKKGKRNY